MTERVAAEALGSELENSEVRFRVALAHSGVIAFEHDELLRYTWIYPTQFYETSQVLGKTDAELFSPEDAKKLLALKRAVLETGKSIREEVSVTREGRRYDYMLTCEALRDGAGNIVGLTGASTNITEAKQVQDELAIALAFRDKAIGIVGHDLRNPLGSVYTRTQLLLREPELPQSSRQHVLRMEYSAKRMLELIASLLDFADARFNAQLAISPAPSDLAEIVGQVIEELRDTNPGREIVLESEGDSGGSWDPARLAQVASNLIGNALKHGAKTGLVRVIVRSEAETTNVSLSIHNSGPAIDAEIMPGLFEAFHGDRRSARGSTDRGLGLGLHIADQIVRAHGGSIAVSSDAEHGTEFRVRLPRIARRAPIVDPRSP